MSEPVDLNVDGFTRLRIDFGYDGTDFYGWSKQPDLRTIQGAFLEALTLIFGESDIDFSLRVAGRTDAGVHALHQVAHFDLTDTQLARLGRETIDDIAYKLNRLLPDDLRASIEAAEAKTANYKKPIVNLAVAYSGRTEIADAVKSILKQHSGKGESIDQLVESLTPELIAEHLYTGGQADPDLIIRTSGEQRLSGFLLWQSSNSELYFEEALWPDFRKVDFLRAIRAFANRHRRFGA